MSTALATRSNNGIDLIDPNALSGRQKAAILCLALGSDVAASITQTLTQEEVDAISFEIARMSSVSPEVVDTVLDEWMTRLMVADSLAQGGVEAAREILEKAFGPRKAQQVLERIQGQLQNTIGLHRLRNADAQHLGQMLAGEHPQTIALILAHLDPQHTAAILKELDTSIGAEVVFRMAKMEKVQPELLMLIERSLSADADLTASQGMSSSGGPAAVASVLNYVAASLEKVLLDGVASMDQVLCDQIKNLMFVFEDIGTLDARALQRLLRDVDSKELALALKAASADLRSKITGAMSQRAVQALSDEMEMLGAVRMRDVEGAQANIVAMVRKLEEAGEIVLGGGDDDMVQ
ncbi:MAG TPA: flagellar motor switch protein FliG [Casimicrobiaceae bacterium]|nr:flagellar motor switch protein FliG [Casimicrobiaceae bacterium]